MCLTIFGHYALKSQNSHCVKKCPNTNSFVVRIFLYTDWLHSVNLRIPSEYRKILTRKNSVFRHFPRSVIFLWFAHLLIVSRSLFIAYFCVSFTTEKIELLLANIFKIKDILDDKYKKIFNKEYKEYMVYKE